MSIEEFPRTGRFTIGTGAAGAPHVRATLNVIGSAVGGPASFSQPVSPPLGFVSEMKGHVHVIVSGADVRQIHALEGTPIFPPDLAAPFILSMVIVLDGIWGTKGTASYTYVTSDKQHVKVENQPVKVQWLLAD